MHCKSCVLDKNIGELSLNERGICKWCEEISSSKNDIKYFEKLESLVDRIKSKGQFDGYDCITGISGGVDSSYVLHLLKELNLKPLVVHFDNGWNNGVSSQNIAELCKQLDFDLYTYVIDFEKFKKMQRHLIRRNIINLEMLTDHGIFALLYKIASENKIKTIIDGQNFSTEQNRMGVKSGIPYYDLVFIKAVLWSGGFTTKGLPTMGLFKKYFYRRTKHIEQISILNHVHYEKDKAKELLMNRYGWIDYGGKHEESTFTKWFQSIYLFEKFAFDKRRLHLSDSILSNQLGREEALKVLEKSPITNIERKRLQLYVSSKLGIPMDELEEILTNKITGDKLYPKSRIIRLLGSKLIKKNEKVI